jgi:hypothetical protein
MNKDALLFKPVVVKKVAIDGREIELPIRYYRDSVMLGIFTAPTTNIIKLLPTSRFKPIEIFPSRSLVSLVGLRHYDTSIGPFDELDIGILVMLDSKPFPFLSALFYDKNPRCGIYMYRLFVSDEKALTAGVKVWNYPKVIADIKFDKSPTHHVMKIKEGGKNIISLFVRKSAKHACDYETVFHIYSIKDRMILKSPVDWKGKRSLSRSPRFASFEIGSSSYTDELMTLGLQNYCVEGVFYSEVQYILNPPSETFPLESEK